MTTQNFGTGFQVYAQGRVVAQVSDRQVSDRLRVTRFAVLKNQPTGQGLGENGYPITKSMSVLVDFKNLSDEQVAQLTIGSLIRFEGELMEQRFQPKDSDAWVSYHSIEAWDFQRISASKAERTANKPPAAAPVKREMATAIAQDVVPAASYDDIPF